MVLLLSANCSLIPKMYTFCCLKVLKKKIKCAEIDYTSYHNFLRLRKVKKIYLKSPHTKKNQPIACEYETHERDNDTLKCDLYTQSAIPNDECDFHTCNFLTQCKFDMHKCDNDTHDCDLNTHKSDFYTQSVILTCMSVITTRTSVIYTFSS
jgi:hypothetical protein